MLKAPSNLHILPTKSGKVSAPLHLVTFTYLEVKLASGMMTILLLLSYLLLAVFLSVYISKNNLQKTSNLKSQALSLNREFLRKLEQTPFDLIVTYFKLFS